MQSKPASVKIVCKSEKQAREIQKAIAAYLLLEAVYKS